MWLDRLKEMKAESGLTTKEISHLAKIPEPTLEKIFAGTTKDPKLDTMRQLVHFFNHSLDDLIDDSYTQKKTSPLYIEMNGLDEMDKKIIPLLGKLSVDQKQIIYDLVKATVERQK